MNILPSMLGRTAYVRANKRTARDGTAAMRVTTVAAHAGGLLRDKAYFTVMYQAGAEGNKYFFTYPAGWVYFWPEAATPATAPAA